MRGTFVSLKTPSVLTSVLVAGSLALMSACSADPETGGSGGFGGTGVSGTGVSGTGVGGTGVGGTGGVPSNYCMGATSKACICPDGSMRTQGCNNGPPPSLLPCACDTGGTGGTSGAGGDSAPLCAELANMPGCMADTFLSPKLPASILFLVDRSGSMLCNPPPTQTNAECDTGPLAAMTKDTNSPTKWRVTIDALASAFTSLAQSGGAKAALTLFSNDEQCGVGATPSVALADLTPAHAGSLSNALNAVQPAGATPIVGGTMLGYQYLHWEVNPGCSTPPCGAPGNRFVVLITDGADTCSETSDKQALLTTEVQKARMANIRTFVIGAPGSEPARGFLSELAFQGGTARSDTCTRADIAGAVGDCHFDLASSTNLAADLQAALGDISGAALTCEFTVPGGVGSDVNVQYTLSDAAGPVCVPQLAANVPCDGTTDGWTFARDASGAEDRSKVLLCGPACDSVKADLEAQVDVIRMCAPLG